MDTCYWYQNCYTACHRYSQTLRDIETDIDIYRQTDRQTDRWYY